MWWRVQWQNYDFLLVMCFKKHYIQFIRLENESFLHFLIEILFDRASEILRMYKTHKMANGEPPFWIIYELYI